MFYMELLLSQECHAVVSFFCKNGQNKKLVSFQAIMSAFGV